MRLAALKKAPYAFGSRYETERDASDERWRNALEQRTRFIAEVNGDVAGTISGGAGSTRDAAAMTAMWVDPRFRRRGVGDRLVKTLVEWARAHGYRRMFLWVTDGNTNAERLYERHGFVRTGATQEVRPREVEFEMERDL